MKKIMTYLLISIVAIIAMVFIIGLFIPKERTFTKTAVLHSDVNKVFNLVSDFKNQTTWRNDVKEVIVIDGNTWTEVPKKGTPITFKTKQKIHNELFEIEIIEPKNFSGYWVGTFEQTTAGTKVVFKEVVTIDNPLFRVMSLIFVDLDKTMEVYLNNMKTKLGE
jgi:Polyketide cyclase / dehydrase and lipid transport